ncbi:hypothetical protein [Streptomyces griseus]|uniref:hypothetical protein n=1 Tax=Streptomyces griseus TaxID=1911 RepID=UPI000AEC845D|nr:hypothetical protein [Streptomyces griseus]
MSEHTSSQAEGEPEEDDTRDTTDHPFPNHPTPSQAEGEREDSEDDTPTTSPERAAR